LLVLTDTLKAKMNIALFYQFPNDAIIMSGQFNDAFYHGIPAVDSWPALFSDGRVVRELPPDEKGEAMAVMERVQAGTQCTRYNVTIRWHETHNPGCPFLSGNRTPVGKPPCVETTAVVDTPCVHTTAVVDTPCVDTTAVLDAGGTNAAAASDIES